jgi:hypothetical protein
VERFTKYLLLSAASTRYQLAIYLDYYGIIFGAKAVRYLLLHLMYDYLFHQKRKQIKILLLLYSPICVWYVIRPKLMNADAWVRLIGLLRYYPASTSSKDLREKFDVYEEAGVKEYWVVHSQEQIVLIYALNASGKYEGILKPYICTHRVSSLTLPELTISLEDVFPEVEY